MNAETNAASLRKEGKKRKKGQIHMIVLRFRKNKLAMIGLFVLVILMVTCLSAPLWLNYRLVTRQKIVDAYQAPSSAHLFGTDQFGRDLFARIIYGGQISLFAGLITVFIAFLLGVALGGAAGYFGGTVDNVIMRFCDILMSVPGVLLSMCIVAALGQGLVKMLIALSVAQIPRQARTVRAAVMTLRGQEFVEAARSCGSSNTRILLRHMLPNVLGPIIIGVMQGLGGTILSIASLGFLGIGIAPPTPEWGTIISENQNSLMYYPYLGIIPGLFIVVAVLSLNFIGDGLRDALDPKQKN
ncbi:MAG: ABC transporter permease [Eubacteriales bacterium]|nr:ABC transporter permease [Eubacteriales bacterium]